MFCQLVLLVLLSSLQPGRLQAEGIDVRNMLQNIDRNTVHLNSMISSYVKWSEEFKAQMEDSTLSLRADLSSLNDSVNNLSMFLREHKQQTAAELAQLQTFLNTIQSSHQNQQSNLTHQLEAIQSNVEQLPVHTCGGTGGWRRVAYLNMTHPNLLTCSAAQVYCNDETGHTEYRSCSDVNLLGLPSGTYTIRPSGGTPVIVYCDMDMEECGGGVWTRVASYSYSDPNTTCPTTWNQITDPFRGCGVAGAVTTNNCASTSFSTVVEFNQVCGEVIAIQRGHPAAFLHQDDIDNVYVEGVSITHGCPRWHIWTFAAYSSDSSTATTQLCPCSQPSLNVPPPPSFVGDNYFCDTAAETVQEGWHLDDSLWDGEGCPSTSTCCSFNNPPWFIATLPQHTTDDIEVRICDSFYDRDDTAIVLLKLYIK